MTARTIEAANPEIARSDFAVSIVVFVLAGIAALWINSKAPFHEHGNLPLLAIPGGIAFFGLVYLGKAILNGMRVSKSGKSFMDVEEARYGGAVRGQIRTERSIEPRGDYTLHLVLIEHVDVSKLNSDGGTTNYTKSVVRWERRENVRCEGVSSTHGIPVNVPVERFPWPEPNARSQGFHWELTIDAPLRGLNYSAVFGIRMEGQPRA